MVVAAATKAPAVPPPESDQVGARAMDRPAALFISIFAAAGMLFGLVLIVRGFAN
jgi:hypothetical protein